MRRIPGNSTRGDIRWKDGSGIGKLADRPVRLRFQMDRGDLYSFWVSSEKDGKSGWYVAGAGRGLPAIAICER